MKKQIFSFVLTFVLCLNLVPPAMAYSMGQTNQPATTSAGKSHTAIIDANGSLWMWGRNLNGELGLGGTNTDDVSVPVKVMDNVSSVSCGDTYTAAIKTDGSLWMWGTGYRGELGNGTTEGSSTPIKVMDGVASVSCGYGHTAAIKTDGSLWMWGENSKGELTLSVGTGDQGRYQTTPVKVMDNVSTVALGWMSTIAIKSDKSLWRWGRAVSTKSVEPVPVPQKLMDDVVEIDCTMATYAALKTDGSLWLWGSSQQGELGNGSASLGASTDIPEKVMDNVASVSCGFTHIGAVKTDGSLWMWGDNGSGQLGNGYQGSLIGYQGAGSEAPIVTRPAWLMDGVASFTCGYHHTVIIKTDGTMWVCGSNSNGQLGNNKQGDREAYAGYLQTVPVQISGLTPKLPGGATAPDKPTTPVSTVGGFTDVKSTDFFADAVTWAVDKNITSGTSATTFSPNKTCTVGQILTFLWRSKGSPEPTIKNPFSNIKESDYYYKPLLWAKQQNLIGLGEGATFNANAPCTRGMTVLFMWKVSGAEFDQGAFEKQLFDDVPLVDSNTFVQPVYWAVKNGVTSGTSATTFSPESICTRGQIVTFLYRVFAK